MQIVLNTHRYKTLQIQHLWAIARHDNHNYNINVNVEGGAQVLEGGDFMARSLHLFYDMLALILNRTKETHLINYKCVSLY